MSEDRKRAAGEEVRSPIQVIVRLLLLVVVVAVLVGVLVAVFLRPDEVVEPRDGALAPASPQHLVIGTS